MYKFQPSFDYQLLNNVSVFLGPTLTFYNSFYDSLGVNYQDIAFYPFYDKIKDARRLQLCLGLRISF